MSDRQLRGGLGLALVPAIAVAVTATSWAVLNHGPRAVAEVAIVPYTACVALGAAFVYPSLRRRGARSSAAALGALAIPLAWLTKELVRVTAVFSPAEALYYALNPLSLGVFSAAGVQIALAEIWLRSPGARLRPLWPAAVLCTALVLALAAWLVGGDSGGRDIFYTYIALYRALFPAS